LRAGAAAVGETIDRLRDALPASVRVGGAVAENHDLEAALAAKTPLVIGVVLVLGFLLLLVALQAPLIASFLSYAYLFFRPQETQLQPR